MSNFFLDSSALVKRYLTEAGSQWIRQIANPAGSNSIIVAEITLVEAASALAARHRSPNGISRQERDAAVNLVARHFQTEYQLIPTSKFVVAQAVTLTQNHRLRGYDAVQLAAALAAHEALRQRDLTPLIFVAADQDLLAAAQAEGLAVINPHDQIFP
jgi:uncharacterized protein